VNALDSGSTLMRAYFAASFQFVQPFLLSMADGEQKQAANVTSMGVRYSIRARTRHLAWQFTGRQVAEWPTTLSVCPTRPLTIPINLGLTHV